MSPRRMVGFQETGTIVVHLYTRDSAENLLNDQRRWIDLAYPQLDCHGFAPGMVEVLQGFAVGFLKLLIKNGPVVHGKINLCLGVVTR